MKDPIQSGRKPQLCQLQQVVSYLPVVALTFLNAVARNPREGEVGCRIYKIHDATLSALKAMEKSWCLVCFQHFVLCHSDFFEAPKQLPPRFWVC